MLLPFAQQVHVVWCGGKTVASIHRWSALILLYWPTWKESPHQILAADHSLHSKLICLDSYMVAMIRLKGVCCRVSPSATALFLQGVMWELTAAIWTAFATSFKFVRTQVAWHFPQDAMLFAIYDLRHEWGAQFGEIIRDHSTLNKSYFRGQESNASLTLTQLSGHRSLWQRTGRIITIHICPVA